MPSIQLDKVLHSGGVLPGHNIGGMDSRGANHLQCGWMDTACLYRI